MTIIRDDGNWIAEPSGLNSGDLVAWRNKMYQECPDPKVGDIVIVTNEKNGKHIGYRAQTAEGYETRWLRVSSEILEQHLRMIDVKDGGGACQNLDEYIYLSDGVYIHKDDCWF